MWEYIYLRLSICPHNIVIFDQQVLTYRVRAIVASHLDKPVRKKNKDKQSNKKITF